MNGKVVAALLVAMVLVGGCTYCDSSQVVADAYIDGIREGIKQGKFNGCYNYCLSVTPENRSEPDAAKGYPPTICLNKCNEAHS